MFIYLATYSDLAIFVLRLALGAILIVHGWPKLRNMKKTAEAFDQMGFKPGALFGGIAGFLEFFGGIAILVGFMVQPVAAIFILQFLVIIAWRLLKKHAFVGAVELDILILGSLVLILSLGAGAYSADAALLFPGF